MQLKNYLLFVAASAMAVFAQTPDPSINTPSGVQECLPVQLTFSGSSPPFIITVVPATQAGAAPLVTVGTTSADAISWTANLPAGDYTLVIRDSLGRTNPSGTFTINAGDATCLTASAAPASTAAGTSPAGSTTVVATATVPATTVAAVTTPVSNSVASQSSVSSASSTSKAASSVASSAAAATSSKAASGAVAQQPLGLVGLVGLVGVGAAALL